jgi:hypothetical protein
MSHLDWMRQCIREGRYVLSRHAEQERLEEDIDVAQIEEAILLGKIIEDYPDDPRGHSCLVSGYADGRFIHVVCGQKGDWVVIITVYIPKPPHWRDSGRRWEVI